MASYATHAPNGVPKGWALNEKIKTCKCETCGLKVKFWSFQCVECGRHICSQCHEVGSDRTQWMKDVAQDHVSKGCWHRFGPANMNPKFARRKPDPPVRKMEEDKARASKGLAASNREPKPKGASSRSANNLLEDESSRSASDMASDLFDDDDKEQIFTPTITATRPQRKGLKRKSYVDEESEDEMFVRGLSGKAQKWKVVERMRREPQDVDMDEGSVDGNGNVLARLHDETTVVVGAGVVGLFIAREIALEARKANIEHRVVIIEFREGYCQLASGHCPGFLSTKDMPEDWKPIANQAKQCWPDILSSSETRQRLQFDANTPSRVVNGVSSSQHKPPSWLRDDVQLSVLKDPDSIGQINAVMLATWLHEQCEMLGVEFHFEASISGVDFDADSVLAGVQLCNASGDGNSVVSMPCKNLVLAAGPFTTGIFNSLFTNTPLELENHVQGSDWFQVKTAAIGSEGSTAFRIPHAAEDEDRLDNEIYMFTNPSDNGIIIAGTTTHIIRNKHLNSSFVQAPGRGKTSELKLVAAKYLNAAHIDVEARGNIVHRGRSELGVANRMRPVIDGLPASGLGLAYKDGAKDLQPSGVWLCYGFGKFGTMLAPGAASIMVSRMSGRTSVSMEAYEDFLLPPVLEPQAKGKGKAKV